MMKGRWFLSMLAAAGAVGALALTLGALRSESPRTAEAAATTISVDFGGDCSTINPDGAADVDNDIVMNLCATDIASEDPGIGMWGVMVNLPSFVSGQSVTACSTLCADAGSPCMGYPAIPPDYTTDSVGDEDTIVDYDQSCAFTSQLDGPPLSDGNDVLLAQLTLRCESKGSSGVLDLQENWTELWDGDWQEIPATLGNGTVSCNGTPSVTTMSVDFGGDCSTINPNGVGVVGQDIVMNLCATDIASEDPGIGGWAVTINLPSFVSGQSVTPCSTLCADGGSPCMTNAVYPPDYTTDCGAQCSDGIIDWDQACLFTSQQDGPPLNDGDDVLLAQLTLRCDGTGASGALDIDETWNVLLDGDMDQLPGTLGHGTVACRLGSAFSLAAGGPSDLDPGTIWRLNTTAGEPPALALGCSDMELGNCGATDTEDEPTQDDVDALSYGDDFIGLWVDLRLSVHDASGQGLSGTHVERESSLTPDQAHGDQFGVLPQLNPHTDPASNVQVFDENGSSAYDMGLVVSDDVDALDNQEDPTYPILFSLTPSSPTIGTLRPGDILKAVSSTASAPPEIYASYSTLGLVTNDDIDALCVMDKDDNGTYDPADDRIWFSLSPSSPTVTGSGGSITAADILAPRTTGPTVFHNAARLGLKTTDNLNAMKCVGDPLAEPGLPCPDIDGDGIIYLGDRGKLSAHWFLTLTYSPHPLQALDLDGDNIIYLGDRGPLSAKWFDGCTVDCPADLSQ